MSYLFQGLIYIAPLGITVYVVYFLFNLIDGFLQKYIQQYLNVSIPGMGIVFLVVFLVLLGFIGQTVLARPFRRLVNRLFEKTPLVKIIYTSIRDLLSAFVGKEKKFNRPVLVVVNTISNLEKMGFLTQDDLTELNIKDKVSVYFPHSYNFSGEMFVVPSELVRPLDMPATDALIP